VGVVDGVVLDVGPDVVEGDGGALVVGEVRVEALVSGPCSAMMPTKPTVVALRRVRGSFIVLSSDGVRLLVQRFRCDTSMTRKGDCITNEGL
jgi:hypothetical protein